MIDTLREYVPEGDCDILLEYVPLAETVTVYVGVAGVTVAVF